MSTNLDPAAASTDLLCVAAQVRGRLTPIKAAATAASTAARDLALALHDAGYSDQAAADAVGLSRQRVGQLVRARAGAMDAVPRPVGRPRLTERA